MPSKTTSQHTMHACRAFRLCRSAAHAMYWRMRPGSNCTARTAGRGKSNTGVASAMWRIQPATVAVTYALIFLGDLRQAELQYAFEEPRPSTGSNEVCGADMYKVGSYRFSSLSSVSELSVLSSWSGQPPGLSRTNRLDSRYSSSSSKSSAMRIALIGLPAACVRRKARHSR